MTHTKVIIVDDHKLLLEGINSLLQNIGHIDVIGKASSGEEAVNMASELNPHVILMDIMMKGMTGIEASRWIKEQNADIKIILISSDVTEKYVSLAIQAGVDGYLPKNVNKETLVEAINQVQNGERYFDKKITDIALNTLYKSNDDSKEPTESKELTKRENEVLYHLALGKSNHEIADELFISIKTVETHKSNIMSKMDFKNMVELTKYAIKNNIIDL